MTTRIIEFKIIDQGADAEELDYKKMLRQIMSITPEGVTYDQMKAGMIILDKIDAAEDELELDAGEYRDIAAKVKAHKWPQMHQEIVNFVDTVLDAAEKPSAEIAGNDV